MGISGNEIDSRNNDILIYIDGEIFHRNEARISVFDSLVQGGDGVWEGLRLYNGRIYQLDQHIRRLQDSAKALHFSDIPDQEQIENALVEILKANKMRTDVHIRMTLSRGLKETSGMSPTWNKYGSTLIIVPEWKPPVFGTRKLKLITSAVRRNSPESIDSKIHHNNLINNILAKIQANEANVDEAVMLDRNGYVAETNACNIFFVKGGEICTPHADYCLPGITRKKVIEIAKDNDLPIFERNISIAEMYSADECFVTGTMGELTSVEEIDGRKILGDQVTNRLRTLYNKSTQSSGFMLPEF